MSALFCGLFNGNLTNSIVRPIALLKVAGRGMVTAFRQCPRRFNSPRL